MEFSKAVKGRRSIRKYQDRIVPDSEVERLLDLARRAPSSMNGQPWHFVIVKDDKTKRALAEIKNRFCPADKRAYPATFSRTAPVIIVVCVDKNRSFGREVENGMLATSIILLGAQSRGLGSVCMMAYNSNEPKLSEEIKRALNIPQGIEPVSILPLGYADEISEPKQLRPFQEIVHLEHF